MPTTLKKCFALLSTLGAVAALYGFGVRPWLLHWGASPVEQTLALPGDEIAPGAVKSTTRGVTIDAPADAVWPWLAQLGQDRAGFYSFELLEDLVGCEMPRADRILPQAQHWGPGDSLWMYPPEKLDGIGGAPLLAAVPGRALAFGTWFAGTAHNPPPDGSWAFVLAPGDAGTTRLLVRSRSVEPAGAFGRAFDRGVFEPVHFVMERRMMESIRRLAEGRAQRSRAADAAEILVWASMLAAFVWGIGAVLRRRRWLPPLLAAAAAALGFQLVTFTQPPALAGALLVAVLAGALLHGARREAWPQIAPSERLDRWLPDAPFRDSVVVASTASNAALMQALFEVSLREMPLARLVGTLRYLPALLGSGEAKRRARLDARRPFVPAVASGRGSVVLEQVPDELVVGTVAKLHQIRDQEPADVRTPAEFAAFAVPNHERLAMSLRTLPWGDRSLLVFEHRTQATDALAHRRFARYWLVIRPGGAFVSRQLLRAVARRAERAAAAGRPAPAVTG
jgi:hypothetical protein